MTKKVYIEASPKTADAIHCEQCCGMPRCFYEGSVAIQNHADAKPLHTQITYLRREVA